MKKIAIISYFHTESSVVLAKHLSDENIEVEYFLISKLFERSTPGINFEKSKNNLGIQKIVTNNQELKTYLANKNLKTYLIRLFGYSKKYNYLNIIVIYFVSYIISKKNFDVVNFIGQNNNLIYFHKKVKTKIKIHTLHEVSNHFEGQKVDMTLLNYLNLLKIPLIFHSKITYDRMLNLFPDLEKRDCIIIPFGLFETYKYFNGVNSSLNFTNYILFYGFIQSYKGLDTLVNSIKLLETENSDIKFVIAGSGDMTKYFGKFNTKNVFIINKFLENHEIASLNSNAAVIVCPYNSASQSGIISTTFLFNRPIIATRVGAFEEFIIHNKNGILIEPGDYKQLAESIKLLSGNKNIYNDLLKGISEFQNKYSWQIISRKTYDFYRKFEERPFK